MYTIKVTATDDDNGSGSATVGATVINADPTISAPTLTLTNGDDLPTNGSGDPTVTGGTVVNLSGSFEDLGPEDTHTVTIDWGDGTSDTLTFGGNTVIDFERDGQLNPLLSGDLAGNAYLDQAGGRGFTISTGDPSRPPMIFDSANPTGGDFDIATPNIHYGGLGQHATVQAPGSVVTGKYGSFSLLEDGSYSYVVNSNSPSLAMLQAGQTLTETFHYTLTNGVRASLDIVVGRSSSDPTVATTANGSANPYTGTLPLVGTEVANVIVSDESLRIEGASTTTGEGMNNLALGKVLIISKDGDATNPNDDEAGGRLIFDFKSPVYLESIDIIDINEKGGTIQIYDARVACSPPR
ncbi:VCBS domain-containing protein [Verrucomicrobium spinosum]|uniref:VCBS domain-containing protein n=1 Tax=Verrucomicrobium spinosum TaxID=2736 RepID=UPI0009464543|nr:VCBS domain-containing protein [Verrucomicrobium spinosum]